MVETQAALWNGAGGQGWVELQDIVDGCLQPLERLLVDAVADAATGPAARLLDVGCGTGGTTVAMARRLGSAGDYTGIDIAEPMIAAARRRAEHEGVAVHFERSDAQRHRFEPPGFDVVASRFGVMFFDDFVGAFANLRAAASAGGALRFLAWRGPEENPFMTAAAIAAAPLIEVPAHQPDEPGQFAFADAHRVREILERAGWHNFDVQPVDVSCTFAERSLDQYLTHLGPVGRVLGSYDATIQQQVLQRVRPAFDAYIDGTEVRFTAACWMVVAEA